MTFRVSLMVLILYTGLDSVEDKSTHDQSSVEFLSDRVTAYGG